DGINISNSGVSILSNAVFSNAQNGLVTTAGGLLQGNTTYGNVQDGILFFGNGGSILGNVSYGNGTHGLDIQGNQNIAVMNNNLYQNANVGLSLLNTSSSTVISNTIDANGLVVQTKGMTLTNSSNNLFFNNSSFQNGDAGIYVESGSNNNIFIANYSYGNLNAGVGLAIVSGPNAGTVWADGGIGYSSASVQSPNAGDKQIYLDASAAENLTLKRTLLYTPGIIANDFNAANTYLLSYNENDNNTGISTGTAAVYGDYKVSGSTFTLDYSTYTYEASATSPIL